MHYYKNTTTNEIYLWCVSLKQKFFIVANVWLFTNIGHISPEEKNTLKSVFPSKYCQTFSIICAILPDQVSSLRFSVGRATSAGLYLPVASTFKATIAFSKNCYHPEQFVYITRRRNFVTCFVINFELFRIHLSRIRFLTLLEHWSRNSKVK